MPVMHIQQLGKDDGLADVTQQVFTDAVVAQH